MRFFYLIETYLSFVILLNKDLRQKSGIAGTTGLTLQALSLQPQGLMIFSAFTESNGSLYFSKKHYQHQLSCCAITYHRTLGFWEIISLSKASTKSLSYPVLSNLLVSGSVTAAGDLFYIGRRTKELLIDSKMILRNKDWTPVIFLKELI